MQRMYNKHFIAKNSTFYAKQSLSNMTVSIKKVLVYNKDASLYKKYFIFVW